MVWMFIDDKRDPYQIYPEDHYDTDALVWTKNYQQTIEYFQHAGIPRFISFDHDLGLNSSGDGLDIIKWMIKRDLESNGFIPERFQYVVHSANPSGAENMKSLLESYLKFKEE